MSKRTPRSCASFCNFEMAKDKGLEREREREDYFKFELKEIEVKGSGK